MLASKGVPMRTLILVTLAIAATPIGWRPVEACGDKFLLVGRGVRFQRAYAAVHPANILIYARPTTSANRAIRDPQFQKSLRQAGHQVSVIEDPTLFEHALQLSPFDIVLADLLEAPAIDRLVTSSPSHAKVLYVEYPTGSTKALASQFMCELKAGDRATRFLDKIDAEMKTRIPRGAATK
jgi:hypothetical protein